MESLRELYRIGTGPSASHTLGPRKAAERFRARTPDAPRYRVALHGSLAATGRGHRTDAAIAEALAPAAVDFVWRPDTELPMHPNGMEFESLGADGAPVVRWRVYSVGGGALREEDGTPPPSRYDRSTAASLLAWAAETGQPLWAHVFDREGTGIGDHLDEIRRVMEEAIDRGLGEEGALPGPLRLGRKAAAHLRKARRLANPFRGAGMLAAYALAVSEENAAGGRVVTAPTCGASGVVPAVLRYLREELGCGETELQRALATAGLFGNVVKANASISGAEVGCQGEVGTACAMAAAAATQLMGGSPPQVEYAAEMGLEHHLGLTCDPVAGLVQIPCIERNAMAAARALDCAAFALLSDGRHHIAFDQVVNAMKATGKDLPSLYRETGEGGLARVYRGPA